MTSPASEHAVEPIYAGGFVAGLLTARYYALRHPINEGAFLSGAPREIPSIVYLILERIPRVTVDHYIFQTSWRALDHLLLSESPEELEAALAATPGLHFH
jgi:hypothetical protein